MRILIIDNNIDLDSWGSKNLRKFAAQAPRATVYVRRGPEDDLPQNVKYFDRLIVSGSKTSALENATWISHEENFIKSFLNEGKPFLGVCYGHQILSRALGGIDFVRKSAVPELGWTEIEQTTPSKLFEGLPRKFYSFSIHKDEVSSLPPGTKSLAKSKDCEIQAFQLEGRPVFGIQFHPEKGLEDAVKILAQFEKKDDSKKGPKNPFDPKVGQTIFGNFLKL